MEVKGEWFVFEKLKGGVLKVVERLKWRRPLQVSMFGEDLDSEGSSFVVAIGAEIIGSRTEGFVTMNAFCNRPEKLFIRLPPLARNVVPSRLKIL